MQVDPFVEEREELRTGVELLARPRAGALVGVGYRGRRVTRELRFSDQPERIRDEVNLLEPVSQTHRAYLRGRIRMLTALQLSGELGYERAAEIGFPRELESVVYGKGRGSFTAIEPLPMTLSIFGNYRAGDGDDILLESQTPGRSKHKEFEQDAWSYGLTLSAMPSESSLLYVSAVQNRDTQEFAFIRSNNPRYSSPALLEFFLDSDLKYESDLRTLALGANHQLTRRLRLSSSSTITWTRARFRGDDATTLVLRDVTGIHNRILSLQAGLEYEWRPGIQLGFGYRYEEFDNRDLELLELDTEAHRITLSVRVDLEALGL